jgi:hypothetical protein
MTTTSIDRFSERIISLSNHLFSTAYNRVYRRYWDNGDYARMKRPYCTTEWETGFYETYIPTLADPERNMKYYRVAVKAVEALDDSTLEDAKRDAIVRRNIPAGIIDSELLAVVAHHRAQPKFYHGRRLGGYRYLAIIICRSPEEAMRRLLRIVTNFIRKRIRALLDAFHLDDWFCQTEETLYYRDQSISKIERISCSLANSLACLSKALSWFLGKIDHLIGEMARQINVYLAMKEVNKLRLLLKRVLSAPQYLKDEESETIQRLVPILIPS